MSRLPKAELEIRKARKDRILAVLKMPGWKEIEAIMQEEMVEAIDAVSEKDDPSARGVIQCLKRISEKISDELDWGNSASNEYQKRYFKKTAIGDE